MSPLIIKMTKKSFALTSALFASVFLGQAHAGSPTEFRIYLKGIRPTGTSTVSASNDAGSGDPSSTGGAATGAPPDPNGPTSMTFNSCDGVGAIGPTMAGCLSSYTNTPPGTSFSVTNGIQHWTAPVTGTYGISAFGGAGGKSASCGSNPGYGANVRLNITLTAGQVLDIVVGQVGQYGNVSGGGGGATTLSSGGVPIVVAGGGGGCAPKTLGYNGGVTNSKASGLGGSGAEAGAGYYGDAPIVANAGQAKAFVNGAAGSLGSGIAAQGGFGGGGGGGQATYGGGGGGFDGGNGGVGGTSYWSASGTSGRAGLSTSYTSGNISVDLQ